ncbi:MAG: AAA family ATPase [Desulfobulbaceae bacterium]|uniref:AAA family ATPase n=1 Tax=Candidatus Desulfobia pelagia TaxID=2841692 RepID=A0A8J6NDI4_9BACT|nr:AAA family ATPase [Candidatus Desulfobia pelagia]
MSDDTLPNLPDQKELEKEIGDYLSRKYGSQVKIISTGLFPSTKPDGEKKTKVKKEPVLAFHFDLKPEDLVAYLDEYVVKQDEAKAVLSTKICTHFNRIRHDQERGGRASAGQIKSNVLLVGPTGVGKTYLIKLIAKRIGVPFVKGDATKFSETGYVGGDVEDLVRDLVREADDSIEKAQCGIIYVDEIDKIAASPHRIGIDVSRTGVQRAFLKPMEETEVELKVPHDPISQIQAMEHYRATGKREKRVVNTRNILFIMSGAFTGLEETVSKRIQRRSIGFEQHIASPVLDYHVLKQVKAQDLIEYGFESEFVGRLPVVAVLDELTEDDHFQILMNPNSSVVVAKKQDFAAYGIKLQFEEAALRAVAKKAVKERTGARGLVSVMEHTLLHYEMKLPSSEIRHLVVTSEMVDSPLIHLTLLLENKEIQEQHVSRYEELNKEELERLKIFIAEKHTYSFTSHGLPLSEKRLNLIASQCQQEIMDPWEACRECIKLINHIKQYAEAASDEYNILISFNDAAIDLILDRHPLNFEAVDRICDEILSAFEYGLRLIGQKSDTGVVEITEEGVANPVQFINKKVNAIFKIDD